MNRPHLYVGISSHGYGHLAQVAPVLNRLRAHHPALEISLATTLPAPMLARLISGRFRIIPQTLDFGMCMQDALRVDIDKSHAAYIQFHQHFEERANRLARQLQQLKVDLVFSDIPYLLAEAASRAHIPCVALCSLNWADIIHGYFPDKPDMLEIEKQIRLAYASCDFFLMPEPSMPMPGLLRARPIGPVAMLGSDRRQDINALLGLSDGDRLALVNLGGIPLPIDFRIWPFESHLHYLVDAKPDMIWPAHMHSLCDLNLDFKDILASVDILVTKPGYGNFVAAACHALKVLYVRRPDWPEEPYLVSWLNQVAQSQVIGFDQLLTGQFMPQMEEVFEQPEKPGVAPYGIEEASQLLASFLS
ncbi:MAG: hypothetical protein KGL58_00455 [Pseudomonadota bacterium]|nr:hypothetical protein [Pseudomonadota bacterium]